MTMERVDSLRRRGSLGAISLTLAVLTGAAHADSRELPVADLARLKARTVCSCLFVQRMSFDQCSDGTSTIWRYASAERAPRLLNAGQRLDVVLQQDGAVVRMLAGESVIAQSRFIADGGGCVTLPGDSPAASTGVPHGELLERAESQRLPRAKLPQGVDGRAIEAVLEEGFSRTGPLHGLTRAVVVINGGHVVADRYAPGFGPRNEYYLGSIAKVFNNLFAGLLVSDGKLNVKDTVDVPEWRGDSRRTITYDQLLRMVSGLAWDEEFFDVGAPAYTIYFAGSAGTDIAKYMSSRPLEAQPGAHFEYSTGAANLLSAILQSKLDGPRRAATLRFLRQRLFEPIGAQSITPEFDFAGSFIGGHAVHAGAEDLARIGMLLLNDGRWDSRQLLPPGWVAYSTQARPTAEGKSADYGAQLMLDFPGVPGCFGHSGVGESKLAVCPSRDLVVAWLSSVFDFRPELGDVDSSTQVRRLIEAFPERKSTGRE